MSNSANPPLRQTRALFWCAALLTCAAFYWLYLDKLFIVKDLNPEAMGTMLVAGHLERAREKGVPAKEYLRGDPALENLKTEDPAGAFDYPFKLFQFEWQGYSQPLLNAFYAPFVRLGGVSARTVAVFHTLFCALAWLATGALAWRMFGRWGALLAMVFLMSSLSWLIHTRNGYPEHFTSALMLCGVGLGAFEYLRDGRRATLVWTGALVGLLYAMGWITVVFAGFITALAVVLRVWRRPLAVATEGAVALGAAAVAAAVFTFGYALYYQCSWLEVNQRVFEGMFFRFTQGSVPAYNPALPGKLAYAFRCMFWDMETADHRDKCLEGHPAVPLPLAVFFFVGLYYALKRRTAADKAALIWVTCVFGMLGTVYLFQHRYALLGLPAMCLLAARGMLGAAEDLRRWSNAAVQRAAVAVLVLLLVASVVWTHRMYYVEYREHKVAEFETDRVRGHGEFAEWVQANCAPQETLVVLNDPIMFPRLCFHFYTFMRGYRFVYWSRLFNSASTPEQVRAWEQEQLKRYRRIVFAFSTQLLGGPQGQITNDWRPFLAAHPSVQPVWRYAYAGRPPSIVAFGVMQ